MQRIGLSLLGGPELIDVSWRIDRKLVRPGIARNESAGWLTELAERFKLVAQDSTASWLGTGNVFEW
jgi:hypothetical protein